MTENQTTAQSSSQNQETNILQVLARGAGRAFIIQILSAGLIYGIQVFLAQRIGVREYGVYEYATTLGVFFAFPASMGFSSVVLRLIPKYYVDEDWGHLRGIIKSSFQQTLLVSVLVSLVSTCIISWLQTYRNLDNSTALIIGIWSIPLLTRATLQQEIARSLRKIVLALAPSLIIYPLLLLVTLVVVSFFHPLTAQSALLTAAICILITTIGQFILLRSHFPQQIHTVKPQYDLQQWWRIGLVMIFLQGSHLILRQTDTLMLANILDVKAVGIYSAGYKTSLWVNFFLVAINSIAAPMFASLYASKDIVGLQKLVSTSVKWMFFPALVVGTGMIIFVEPVLQLFGNEFISAKFVLIPLIVAQLVNIGSGSVGYLLVMTGHQNQCAIVVTISAGVNIILNLLLINLWGTTGAALATAFSMVLWNLWLHRLVVKYLNIYPSIISAVTR